MQHGAGLGALSPLPQSFSKMLGVILDRRPVNQLHKDAAAIRRVDPNPSR